MTGSGAFSVNRISAPPSTTSSPPQNGRLPRQSRLAGRAAGPPVGPVAGAAGAGATAPGAAAVPSAAAPSARAAALSPAPSGSGTDAAMLSSPWS